MFVDFNFLKYSVSKQEAHIKGFRSIFYMYKNLRVIIMRFGNYEL